MTDRTRTLLGALCAVSLVTAPYSYYLMQRAHFRNLRVVEPGVLYRSGQFDRAGFRRVLHDYGIKTVVNLREESKGGEKASVWERAICAEFGTRYEVIPADRWWAEEGPPPAWVGVEKFLHIMSDPERYPRPVLLHCFAGQHRSGAFCAIYRVEFQRWTPAEALDEMRRCGYDNLDAEWDVRNFVLFYQPSWKRPDGLPHPWSQAAPPSKAPAQPDK